MSIGERIQMIITCQSSYDDARLAIILISLVALVFIILAVLYLADRCSRD